MDASKRSMESLDTEPPQIHVLKKRKIDLTKDLDNARKPWRARGSFDLQFWTQAVKIEEISLERSELSRKISHHQFEGDPGNWSKTDEAKAILESIKAQEQSKKICQERVDQLQNAREGRSLRASYMKLFTTSSMGLAMQKNVGAGPRDSRVQQQFRDKLVEAYGARHSSEPWLWCSILGRYIESEDVTASHLFPWRNGQDTMDAIFGQKRPAELFLPQNGLLIYKGLEKYFDAGKFAIVPTLAEGTLLSEVKRWVKCDQREYQIKIIDPDWEKRDTRVASWSDITFGNLDGRKLVFKTKFRPAARYLYFHYCMEVLRMCWQHSSQGKSSNASHLLQSEHGKPFWGTPGRYLPRNMLLGLVEELGHDYRFLMVGATTSRLEDDDLLLGAMASHVQKRTSILDREIFDPPGSEASCSEGEASCLEETVST
ncbi:uncharacterized protein N7529_003119 [Penicillium soppii]|uniref:uncharacterized protein n=1 Tax=Penicillium soppii TaxID=69789 RepID=UPI00254845D3|nr:uncharacterized protein N7529_003119 [Penicillium soppii]KAJ5874689.1 hypothetical protein N7529_003119 [Penicillium soppii]